MIHTMAKMASISALCRVFMVAYLVTTRATTTSTVAIINSQVTTLMTEPWCSGVFHRGASAAVKLVEVITSLILSTFRVSGCENQYVGLQQWG